MKTPKNGNKGFGFETFGKSNQLFQEIHSKLDTRKNIYKKSPLRNYTCSKTPRSIKTCPFGMNAKTEIFDIIAENKSLISEIKYKKQF